jgi:hypothetical protein
MAKQRAQTKSLADPAVLDSKMIKRLKHDLVPTGNASGVST